jgi:hypothetical protein
MNFGEAFRQLSEKNELLEMVVSEEYILERMKEASEAGRLPENRRINEKLLKLRASKEGLEGMKINIR